MSENFKFKEGQLVHLEKGSSHCFKFAKTNKINKASRPKLVFHNVKSFV